MSMVEAFGLFGMGLVDKQAQGVWRFVFGLDEHDQGVYTVDFGRGIGYPGVHVPPRGVRLSILGLAKHTTAACTVARRWRIETACLFSDLIHCVWVTILY